MCLFVFFDFAYLCIFRSTALKRTSPQLHLSCSRPLTLSRHAALQQKKPRTRFASAEMTISEKNKKKLGPRRTQPFCWNFFHVCWGFVGSFLLTVLSPREVLVGSMFFHPKKSGSKELQFLKPWHMGNIINQWHKHPVINQPGFNGS